MWIFIVVQLGLERVKQVQYLESYHIILLGYIWMDLILFLYLENFILWKE